MRRRAEKCFSKGGAAGTEAVARAMVLEVFATAVVSALDLSDTAAAASSSSNVQAPSSGWSRSTRVCSASVWNNALFLTRSFAKSQFFAFPGGCSPEM